MTKDLDLLGFGDPQVETLVDQFRSLCALAVSDDGLLFDAASVKGREIREGARYPGIRLTLRATIGSARMDLQIDIGFGDDCRNPQEIVVPLLLDMPSPKLRAYPRETVVAEKLETINLLGLQNTRLKDYFDLWFLANRFDFGGVALAGAIAATFARRGSALPAGLPRGLGEEFWNDSRQITGWKAFWNKVGSDFPTLSLGEAVRFIAGFVELPLGAAADPCHLKSVWKAGGPWQDSPSRV